MQYDTHESDLYILPENEQERQLAYLFLNMKGFTWQTCFSDVKGNSWHGKSFLDVFCGKDLQKELDIFVKNVHNIFKK